LVLLTIIAETCSTVNAVADPNFEVIQEVVDHGVEAVSHNRRFRDDLRTKIFKNKPDWNPQEQLKVSVMNLFFLFIFLIVYISGLIQ
jgi:hypothetical protein